MNNIYRLLLAIVCLVSSGVVWANSADNSSTVEKAFITTTLPLSHPVVKQKITINYQISVQGFFNGETRFELPSLSRASLGRSSSFAINGSAMINRQSYATQVWQVDLYPEHGGLLEIPALRFHVNYMDNNGKQQQKSLQSDSLALFAYVPEPLKNQQHYVVSSAVDITDSWSTDKTHYQVGDIIIRELTISVDDIQSIQIPAVKLATIEGLQITSQEPKLHDENNRGQQTARLEQTITYVVKQSGKYQLGGEIFTWWSLEDGLQQETFTAKNIEVAGITKKQIKWFIWCALTLCVVLFFYLWWRKQPRSMHTQLKDALNHKQWYRHK